MVPHLIELVAMLCGPDSPIQDMQALQGAFTTNRTQMKYEQQRSHLPIRAQLSSDGHWPALKPEWLIDASNQTVAFIRHHSNSIGQRRSQSETASRARTSATRGLMPPTLIRSALYLSRVDAKKSAG